MGDASSSALTKELYACFPHLAELEARVLKLFNKVQAVGLPYGTNTLYACHLVCCRLFHHVKARRKPYFPEIQVNGHILQYQKYIISNIPILFSKADRMKSVERVYNDYERCLAPFLTEAPWDTAAFRRKVCAVVHQHWAGTPSIARKALVVRAVHHVASVVLPISLHLECMGRLHNERLSDLLDIKVSQVGIFTPEELRHSAHMLCSALTELYKDSLIYPPAVQYRESMALWDQVSAAILSAAAPATAALSFQDLKLGGSPNIARMMPHEDVKVWATMCWHIVMKCHNTKTVTLKDLASQLDLEGHDYVLRATEMRILKLIGWGIRVSFHRGSEDQGGSAAEWTGATDITPEEVEAYEALPKVSLTHNCCCSNLCKPRV